MKDFDTDILIVGAGPVGLMCAYLAHLSGLRALVLDRSSAPLEKGRADALNARTLQLLEVAGLFDDLYPLGKKCDTSSVWAKGGFVSRQNTWWKVLEGCLHKHFLMLGQSHVEKLLDAKLHAVGCAVKRNTPVTSVRLLDDGCVTRLVSGEEIRSKYVIGADGSRSLVREQFQIPFEITRPEIVWAVIDGVIETDFPKVPEIIVFQAETSDVAWIPREGALDRFYVRMDRKDFTQAEALAKIERAMAPHQVRFLEIEWSSQFSVKESVAEKFSVGGRVFLAGDACHVHSVNGGQGLNTGLADAFNLVWKLNMVASFGAPQSLLDTYEAERKPVAMSVVEASGELVRATKHSATGTHAEDYVRIVAKRAGNVTGMGIRYGDAGASLRGTRMFDFPVQHESRETRMYSLLDYSRFTLFLFGETDMDPELPAWVRVKRLAATPENPYSGQAVLVRPDSYIEATTSLNDWRSLLTQPDDLGATN